MKIFCQEKQDTCKKNMLTAAVVNIFWPFEWLIFSRISIVHTDKQTNVDENVTSLAELMISMHINKLAVH